MLLVAKDFVCVVVGEPQAKGCRRLSRVELLKLATQTLGVIWPGELKECIPVAYIVYNHYS